LIACIKRRCAEADVSSQSAGTIKFSFKFRCGRLGRIEAAAPFPWFGIVRIADAPDDGPDVDAATVDVPAFLMVVLRAAGEGGDVLTIPPI
jgi:hypothetical protein